MLSPCPPSTSAETLSVETFISLARKARRRAVSRIPAMPTMRSRGKADTRRATSHITSSGLVTMMIVDSRDTLQARWTQAATIRALASRRSSRLIPGLRANPAVTTTTSESAVAS